MRTTDSRKNQELSCKGSNGTVEKVVESVGEWLVLCVLICWAKQMLQLAIPANYILDDDAKGMVDESHPNWHGRWKDDARQFEKIASHRATFH